MANQGGAQRRVLLIIGGSIAAYKSLELIRLLHKQAVEVTCVLTRGGSEFITPLSAASLSGNPVYTDLFSLKDETEMGHIRLSREADLIVVAPASANLLAKMAQGLSDDLASTLLLATDKPVAVAPAMNPQMWSHPATQRNVAQLKADGITFFGPERGDAACGEEGFGRMAEPDALCDAILAMLNIKMTIGPLAGKRAIVTAGPTQEPLDPVRYLSNHSSGKQGYALARALAEAGAQVTLVSGPTNLPTPRGVTIHPVTTADEMLNACENALPADIFIGAAAVCDWRAENLSSTKIKKSKKTPSLSLEETPDILARIARHPQHRPALVIGFAAETAESAEDLHSLAAEKRRRKGCDWIVANNVGQGRVFGQDDNEALLLTPDGMTCLSRQPKVDIAKAIVQQIDDYFLTTPPLKVIAS